MSEDWKVEEWMARGGVRMRTHDLKDVRICSVNSETCCSILLDWKGFEAKGREREIV